MKLENYYREEQTCRYVHHSCSKLQEKFKKEGSFSYLPEKLFFADFINPFRTHAPFLAKVVSGNSSRVIVNAGSSHGVDKESTFAMYNKYSRETRGYAKVKKIYPFFSKLEPIGNASSMNLMSLDFALCHSGTLPTTHEEIIKYANNFSLNALQKTAMDCWKEENRKEENPLKTLETPEQPENKTKNTPLKIATFLMNEHNKTLMTEKNSEDNFYEKLEGYREIEIKPENSIEMNKNEYAAFFFDKQKIESKKLKIAFIDHRKNKFDDLDPLIKQTKNFYISYVSTNAHFKGEIDLFLNIASNRINKLVSRATSDDQFNFEFNWQNNEKASLSRTTNRGAHEGKKTVEISCYGVKFVPKKDF